MQDRQLKSDAPAEKGSQRKSGKKGSSRLARIPFRREDVLEEKTFRAMLALERRRAERSRQPFVLMLLDSSAVSAERGGAAFVEKLAPTVSAAIRESDLIGWYQEGTVLGVMFTGVSVDANCSIAEVLYSKVVKALRANLDPRLASKLVLTVHLFPESWGTGRSDRVADAKLYPDLNGGADKRQFPMIVKRGMDILGSVVLMLILAPVLAAIAVAIKLTSKGHVIFKQERLGQLGKNFQCLKFRTMFTDNDPRIHREYVQSFIAGKVQEEKRGEGETVVYKIKDDPRVTPIGRLLRRTSLDEFPQFWNVLRGEMSLVGPRPALLYEFEAYDFWHRRRVIEVKPGVTGLWQVIGRSRTSFDDMVRMDLRYCQRWSLWLDLKILVATPLAVFTGHGAY
jgi:lipopolysaccharide/colanic/teichoic acid biosynthesis glycosyltransferase